jgi:hypothetical protein
MLVGRLVLAALAILALGAGIVACGGSAGRATGAGNRQIGSASTQPVHRPWPTQAVAPAIVGCKRGVQRATTLSVSARREIAEPCGRMDERVKENEALVHTVCTEVAAATSISPDSAEARHIAATCYAEYAKTIPLAERPRPNPSNGT